MRYLTIAVQVFPVYGQWERGSKRDRENERERDSEMKEKFSLNKFAAPRFFASSFQNIPNQRASSIHLADASLHPLNFIIVGFMVLELR